MIKGISEVGMCVLIQHGGFHPPQVPIVLPTIERVAGDGLAQVQWQGPCKNQGEENEEAGDGQMAAEHN